MIKKITIKRPNEDGIRETDPRNAVMINVPMKVGTRLVRKQYNNWRTNTKEAKIYIGVLFALCEGKCPHCGQPMFLSFNKDWNTRNMSATLDHITPLSVALEHTKYGLQILCNKCNNLKRDTVL